MATSQLSRSACSRACVADMRSLMISGPFKAASYLMPNTPHGSNKDAQRQACNPLPLATPRKGRQTAHMPEAANPQLAMGPQKCVVIGPVGLLMKAA